MRGKDDSRPRRIDRSRPSVARMYDYYLGGKDNFAVDRAAVEQVARAMPEIRQLALENRAFLRRAVRYMARQGIRQFIDIGSGLPTAGNTHEVAQEIIPDARVVYVDHDPVVLVHGRAILASDANTTVASADMRDPAEVFGHPETTKLIDFDRPIGVLLIAMVHFLTMDEQTEIMRRLRDTLPAGSCVTLTHVTTDGHSPEAVAQIENVYASTPTPIYFREHAEVARFFDGLDLVDPGLVTIDAWHPDPADPSPEATKWLYGGLGHKG
ncbi:MAG TPA: SAM-dependent methyltransferase [Actinomadura sp.]|nr:SAM-dependent methyltransferase [Actinomadura sp.]